MLLSFVNFASYDSDTIFIILQEPTPCRAEPMEAEEEPELDISQLLPPPTGFIAFAGSGNRSGQSFVIVAGCTYALVGRIHSLEVCQGLGTWYAFIFACLFYSILN